MYYTISNARVFFRVLTVLIIPVTLSLGAAAHREAQPAAVAFTPLYSFIGGMDGASPSAGVALGANLGLYGTTANGGNANLGTVYLLVPPVSSGEPWTETPLYSFQGPDGAHPYGNVAIGRNGVLFGTTQTGGGTGQGVVFQLAPPAEPGGAWIETVLHSFALTDGANPLAGVTIGPNSVLYGTTNGGGASGWGTVFDLVPPTTPGDPWIENVLYNFTGAGDGAYPYGGVVMGGNGALYGTTTNLFRSIFGTVFELAPPTVSGGAWTLTTIHTFKGNPDGADPQATALTIGKGGAIYGTTLEGGSGYGTVFQLTPPQISGGAWAENILYSFSGTAGDGAGPYRGLIMNSNGVLLGTTLQGGSSNHGTVFALQPPGARGGEWTESILHSFSGGSDGGAPTGRLTMGPHGAVFGTASTGGSSGFGLVFQINF